MKNPFYVVIVVTVMAILVSCGATTREIARMSQSEGADVFTEIVSEGSAPTGYADMVIRASLKTPLAGYYSLESKESAQGKAVYHFLMNIDGQAVLWQVEGRKHLLPKYVDGKTSRDPEAGEGMKYVLEKKIRLATGSHEVFFGLPDETYYTTADISVKSGGLYVLEFKPDYKYKTFPTRIPTFLRGVKKFEVMSKEIVVQDS
jgi:hypothetical protein